MADESLKEMTLDLGCGRNKTPGAIGMDNVKLEGVDVVHDLLNFPYPFASGKFRQVVLSHVLEHFTIEDIVKILNEVHRVLTPDGEITISVPHAFSAAAFTDPTHRSFFTFNTFYYFGKSHRRNYYKALTTQWTIEKLWASVNLTNDAFRPPSRVSQFLSDGASRILRFTLNRSPALTFPDLLVKAFPVWLVNIHCRLTKETPA